MSRQTQPVVVIYDNQPRLRTSAQSLSIKREGYDDDSVEGMIAAFLTQTVAESRIHRAVTKDWYIHRWSMCGVFVVRLTCCWCSSLASPWQCGSTILGYNYYVFEKFFLCSVGVANP